MGGAALDLAVKLAASDSFGLLPSPAQRLFAPVEDMQASVLDMLDTAQRLRGGGVLAEYLVPVDPASLIDVDCCS